ncbi:hypothetical protein [Marinobacter subterrani]|uniref:hypothetical protein n=1 Tax=Marinobacter subterrani TaxID=1658765 RepID=UPI002356BEE3|nr:hypothetical protein [Marinobacter subterrani]
MTDKRIHVIYDSRERAQVARITNDEQTADKARVDDHVVMATEPVVASSLLYLTPTLYTVMDDSTWQDIAEGFKALREKHLVNLSGDEPPAMFESTPVDLPSEVAEMRLERMARFPAPANMDAQRELTEILMAHASGREVNQGLFTQASLNAPRWHSLVTETELGDFQEQGAEAVQLLRQQQSSNRGCIASGHDVPRDDLIEEERLQQELAELELLIDAQDKHLGLVDQTEPDDPLGIAMAEDYDEHQTATQGLG